MTRVSRALWDEARRPDAPRLSLAKAILYELQPIRIQRVDWSQLWQLLTSIAVSVKKLVVATVPSVLQGSYSFLRGLTRRHWIGIAVVVAYFYTVRLLHR
jgi:hypothetical protein